MAVSYDKYYQTENLFGAPYPELIAFFDDYPLRGKLLDLGCGQGRDSIPLAKMGFTVTGIDNSKVGIEQMNLLAKNENLPLSGLVTDIYTFEDYANYDFVLLDSMFHFTQKSKSKEKSLIKKIISKTKKGCHIVFCIQDTGKKVEILKESINFDQLIDLVVIKKFEYTFEDQEIGHKSKTNYQMIVAKK